MKFWRGRILVRRDSVEPRPQASLRQHLVEIEPGKELSQLLLKGASGLQSCKFIVGCEGFFGIPVQSVGGLRIMGYGNSMNFVPLTLPSLSGRGGAPAP